METIKIGELELRKVDLFAGLSFVEILLLLFPEDNYVSVVRWVKSSAGRRVLPEYEKWSWAKRAEELNKIVPWKVERHNLMVATNRHHYGRDEKCK